MRADLIMAWLQQQSTRERPDTFTQTALGNRSRTLHGRGEPYISREGFLQDQLVEREFRDGLPQPLVLPLQLLQPLRLIELQAAVLAPPLNGMDGSPSSTEAVGLEDDGGELWK
jgi:hypothetical protein